MLDGTRNGSAPESGSTRTWSNARGSLQGQHHYPYGLYGYYPGSAIAYGASSSPYSTLYNGYTYGMYSIPSYQSETGGAYSTYQSDSSTGYNQELSTSLSYSASTAGTAVPGSTRAYLTVAVPADARVWVGNEPIAQTGRVRQFYSPPLAPDQTFTYEIRARWLEDGRPVECVRRVQVRGGDRVTVDFMSPG